MSSAQSKSNSKLIGRKDRGFSLIELLIVLAILLIVATLAVPNYLAARARANEASAATSVRAIITAENLYRNTFSVFTDLPSLGSEYLTDNMLAVGTKSGYVFSSTPGSSPALEFAVDATPVLSVGSSATGQRNYYGDETAVIRFSLTGAADSTSSPIQ
ncbi:MAG: pili assembly chaperone [Acidobacteria bacterium]|nr:MAG: pili assembly chaperone [Acidobacteriota bacterium]